MAFASQQGDDFVVMMVDRQLSNASNDWLGIADCVRPVLRQLEVQGLGFAALPTHVQSDDLGLWPLRHGDVAHQ